MDKKKIARIIIAFTLLLLPFLFVAAILQFFFGTPGMVMGPIVAMGQTIKLFCSPGLTECNKKEIKSEIIMGMQMPFVGPIMFVVFMKEFIEEGTFNSFSS